MRFFTPHIYSKTMPLTNLPQLLQTAADSPFSTFKHLGKHTYAIPFIIQTAKQLVGLFVSIRPTTGIKPLYTTIATVTMNLIVSAAIVLLNPYVTIYISYKIPPFALSVHIPDVSTSIYVEVDSKVLLGLPFCDKAFVR